MCKTILKIICNVCLCFLFNNVSVLAVEQNVFISKISIGSNQSAYDEFIELHNAGDVDVDLSGWSIKRITSTGGDGGYISSNLGKHITLKDTTLILPSQGYMLLVPRANCGQNKSESCYLGNVEANTFYTTDSFLSLKNQIKLFNVHKDVVDEVDLTQSPIINDQALIRCRANDGSATVSLRTDIVLQNDSFWKEVNKEVEVNGRTSSDVVIQENYDVNKSESISDNQNTNDTLVSGNIKSNNSCSDVISVKINEFLINPEDDDRENEFIELYNDSECDVDLSGWSLEDQVGNVVVYKIPHTILKAYEYQVFKSSQTKIILNNSGDGVILKNAFGNIVDQTPITLSAAEGYTYARDQERQWQWTDQITLGGENVISIKSKSVAINNKKDNSVKTDVLSKDTVIQSSELLSAQGVRDFSDQVILSEILPNPVGRDNQGDNYEWIELFNKSDKEVNLKGWILDDIVEKGSKPYIIEEDLIILPKSYLIISSQKSKLSLNNISDEVNLFWPDGSLVDSVSYQKAPEGVVYVFVLEDERWYWSLVATPGQVNIVKQMEQNLEISKSTKTTISNVNTQTTASNVSLVDFDDEEDEGGGLVLGDYVVNSELYKYVSVADIKKLPLFSWVAVNAVVSTPPNVFENNIFYIWDKNTSHGIQVDGNSVNLESLNIGDNVQLFGEIREAGSERYIILHNDTYVEKISVNNLLNFSYHLIQNIDSDQVGNLVQIKGVVSKVVDQNMFYVTDETGTMRIYLKPFAKIIMNMQEGQTVLVRGQVSSSSLGIRILPRFHTDIEFLQNDQNDVLLVGRNDGWWRNSYVLVLFVVVVLLGVRWLFIQRQSHIKEKY